MVSYAIDCGVPAMTAATVFGTAGVASLSGRVIGGLAADRIGVKRMIVFGLALQAHLREPFRVHPRPYADITEFEHHPNGLARSHPPAHDLG